MEAATLDAVAPREQFLGRVSTITASEENDIRLLAFGVRCALTGVLACCLTISLTYVEFIWWFLMLPVCLDRVANNMIEDHQAGLSDGRLAHRDKGVPDWPPLN